MLTQAVVVPPADVSAVLYHDVLDMCMYNIKKIYVRKVRMGPFTPTCDQFLFFCTKMNQCNVVVNTERHMHFVVNSVNIDREFDEKYVDVDKVVRDVYISAKRFPSGPPPLSKIMLHCTIRKARVEFGSGNDTSGTSSDSDEVGANHL